MGSSAATQLLRLEPEEQLQQALQHLPPEQFDRLARLVREEFRRRHAEPPTEQPEPRPRSQWVRDPSMQWIHEHREELRKYPDHYVAIDPERGIVLAAQDGDEFARKFSELVDREGCRGDKYLQTHTSLHV
jgi:hypothetical protein